MARAFVFYDSKYGNTKLAAEKVAEGMREIEGVEVAVGYVNEVDFGGLVDFDMFVLGAPNHMGRPSWTMKKFVGKLVKQNFKAKKVAVFGTYAGTARPVDRAVRKLGKMVEEKLPNLTLVSPRLSVRVIRIPGPIVEGELPKCLDFGKKIAAQLKT